MKRLILIVSGNIQKAGYRDKVVDIGKNMGLSGYAENLPGGKVRIIAEGEDDKLEIFKDHIDIKNTLIKVSKIKSTFGEATGQLSGFSKLVKGGETDERLDTAANLLKELIDVTRNGFSSIKEDTSAMLEKQDMMLDKQDKMLDKQDMMLDRQDKILEKQEISIHRLNDIKDNTSEIKSCMGRISIDLNDARFSLSSYMEKKFKEQEVEIAEIKATLAKVQEVIKAT